MNVIDLVSQNSNLLSWQQGLQKTNRELILGLSATTKAIVMASAFDSIEKAVLITSSYNEAERLASDFIALLGEEKVHTFLGDDNPFSRICFCFTRKAICTIRGFELFMSRGFVKVSL